MMSTSIMQLVDFALPLSAEDHRCGMKKAKKLRRRAALIYMLHDYLDGKAVDFSKAEVMVDFATFEKKLQEWIASSKTS